jgi:Ca2+-binding RTX toxin-like protein
MRKIWGSWLLAACVTVLGAAPAWASTYSNPGPITVPDPSLLRGPASPPSSAIVVDGLPGAVVQARATLDGVSHTQGGDIDILLAAPAGGKTLLLSDVCSGGPFTGATFTFDDAAPAALPAAASCAGLGGAFKPSDFDAGPGNDGLFSAQAPPGPYLAAMSLVAGASPNGVWQLYVADDVEGQNGSIARGWSLELLPSVSCAGRAAIVAANVGTAGNDLLTGTPGPDTMLGLGGNDEISGLGGNDVICGGEGDDKLRGGAGRYLLRGEAGRDRLKGGGAKDALKGGGGKDTCAGGDKPDTAKSCEKQKSI